MGCDENGPVQGLKEGRRTTVIPSQDEVSTNIKMVLNEVQQSISAGDAKLAKMGEELSMIQEDQERLQRYATRLERALFALDDQATESDIVDARPRAAHMDVHMDWTKNTKLAGR